MRFHRVNPGLIQSDEIEIEGPLFENLGIKGSILVFFRSNLMDLRKGIKFHEDKGLMDLDIYRKSGTIRCG